MILVDTSMWLRFFRGEEAGLVVRSWVSSGNLLVHPLVFGELLLGGLSAQNNELMHSLDWCPDMSSEEVRHFIEQKSLSGKGIGWVDAAILASAAKLDARIATLDTDLNRWAKELGLPIGDVSGGP